LRVVEGGELAHEQGVMMQEVQGGVCEESGVAVLQARVDEGEGKRRELQAQILKSAVCSVFV